MELLKKIKIYPIFYILPLELTNSEILILLKNPKYFIKETKYEVKRIIDYNPKIQKYTIKWKEYFSEENLWELIKNLKNCPDIIRNWRN